MSKWVNRYAAVVMVLPVALGSPVTQAQQNLTTRPAHEILQRAQNMPLAPAPQVTELLHTVLHYDKSTYCGHPRMVAFRYFGGGELIVGHFHAPCKYETYDD